jgi:hypothetical protein
MEAGFGDGALSPVTELDVGGVTAADGRFVAGADVVETWGEGEGLGVELAAASDVEAAGAGGGSGSSTGEGGAGAAAAPKAEPPVLSVPFLLLIFFQTSSFGITSSSSRTTSTSLGRKRPILIISK